MRNRPEFHNLLGFTEAEIKKNFTNQILQICQKTNIKEDSLIQSLKRQYNGYKYHVKAQETLYNAFEIQNYFIRGDMRDYFVESGGTKILLRSLKMQDIPDLRNCLNLMADRDFRIYMKEKELGSPKDWEQFQKDFKQNAFDAGYLTIDKLLEDKSVKKSSNFKEKTENLIALKVPNEEIFQHFQDLLKKFLITNDKFGSLMQTLAAADFELFFENVEIVAFQSKDFLNLKDKSKNIRLHANKEILLHQIFTMTVELALQEETKKGLIQNYTVKNEEKLTNGKSIIKYYK